MSAAVVELLFWIVVFVGLFLLLRRMQRRRKERDQAEKDK